MEVESLFIALVLVAGVIVAYWGLRRRGSGESSPEHFFGGMDEETHLAETRSPADKR